MHEYAVHEYGLTKCNMALLSLPHLVQILALATSYEVDSRKFCKVSVSSVVAAEMPRDGGNLESHIISHSLRHKQISR